MVESALVLVLLLTFSFGIMDFSRLLYAYHFVAGAARDATRYAAVRGSTYTTDCASLPNACYATATDVQSYVQNMAPTGVNAASLTVTTTWPVTTPGGSACSGAASAVTGVYDLPGCPVKVVVSYPFHFMLPFLPSAATTWTLTSTSQMVISQ